MELIVELSGDQDKLWERVAAVKELIQKKPNLSLRIFAPEEYPSSVRGAFQGTDLTVCSQSIREGVKCLAEAGEEAVFVSAGDTGKIVGRSRHHLGTVYDNIHPILAANMPTADSQFIFADVGGSIQFSCQQAAWTALAGRVVARVRLQIESPQIGWLSIGVEPGSGGRDREEIRLYLKTLFGPDFAGNTEINHVSDQGVDVLVTDGYTGNNVLKATEIAFDLPAQMIHYRCRQQPLLLPLAWLLKKLGKVFWQGLNWRDYAAFALLGIRKPVYVAHGRSDMRAFYTALTKAIEPETFEVCYQIEKDPQIRALFTA